MRYERDAALIVVDVQNDFADPAGSLSVAGGAAVVEAVNTQVAAAVSAGASVVYTKDWHPPTTPHFAKDGGIWPVHCVADSWGAELHPGLVIAGPVVHKGVSGEDGYSGFTMRHALTGQTTPTDLEATLRERGVGRVAIVGLATDYCVLATVLDAIELGFETTVLRSAIAAVDLRPGDGERALAAMAAGGARIENGVDASSPGG
ncbi:MAG TPA: isochorismatase family protein [Candidatus Limnocylindrales bacterium]|jgi:nicotinamidase/pyrazinamidase